MPRGVWPRDSAEVRFDKKVRQGDKDKCWIWTGGKDSHGYGQFKANGRYIGTHRFSYQRFVRSIPVGLFVCHSCDNPACVNPAHLFLGSSAENNADTLRKGRYVIRSGELHGSAKLSWKKAKEIRRLYTEGISKTAIARRFGVSFSAIHSLLIGITWKESVVTNHGIKTGPDPHLDERRLIDGIWHAWCGNGWIAECYSENVIWPIEDQANVRKQPSTS